jgi:hypothetical protein
VTPSPNCAVPGTESAVPSADPAPDPVLAAAVDIARAAAREEAGPEPVGRHVGVDPEPDGAATHLFEADYPGYGGWRWAVTVASAGPDTPVTVSEVVLLPGPDALVAPEWVPWQQRVQAGDLGVGDLMPTDPGDPRLVPGYVESDDPAVEEVARETGLGRPRVMSRYGRMESADRWQSGDFGPRSEMARSAPDHCGRCGFYLPLAGSLRAAFGVCGNELAPADGHVVHVEYGCGAHSEVELESSSPVPVTDLVYDDTTMDVEGPLTERTLPTEPPPAEAEPPTAEPSTAEPSAAQPSTAETSAAEPPTGETFANDAPAAEPPATEPSAAEPSAAESPVGEPPVADSPVDELSVGGPQGADSPDSEMPIGGSRADDSPSDEAPVGGSRDVDSPGNEIPVGESRGADSPGDEAPVGETPVGDTPADEVSAGETSAAEPAAAESHVGEAPVADAPVGELSVGGPQGDDSPSGEMAVGGSRSVDSPGGEMAVGGSRDVDSPGDGTSAGQSASADTEE